MSTDTDVSAPDILSHKAQWLVIVDVFGTMTPTLLDSGASISAISEHFYLSIKTNALFEKSVYVLPITGVAISTAVQGRSRKISIQILLLFQILGRRFDRIFLVVPRLATSIILGDDWLVQHGLNLNYLTRRIEFPKWEASCPFQNDPEEIQSPQITRIKIHHRCDTPTLSFTEQCIQNVTKTNQVLSIKSC